MKIAEMKQILVDKFKAEYCNFNQQDINIKKLKSNEYRLYIKDYENIVFDMVLRQPDDYFGYSIMIVNTFDDDYIFIESKNGYDIKSALIELGYYIATRF